MRPKRPGSKTDAAPCSAVIGRSRRRRMEHWMVRLRIEPHRESGAAISRDPGCDPARADGAGAMRQMAAMDAPDAVHHDGIATQDGRAVLVDRKSTRLNSSH